MYDFMTQLLDYRNNEVCTAIEFRREHEKWARKTVERRQLNSLLFFFFFFGGYSYSCSRCFYFNLVVHSSNHEQEMGKKKNIE